MLFFTYSRYFKKRVCHGLMTHPLSFMGSSQTNHMQLIAAYMQLVTPSEVAMAVRMLMAI